jgi:hypothetical protein
MNMDFDQHKTQVQMITEYLDKVGEENEMDFIEYKIRQRIHLEMLRYHGLCPITGKKDKQTSYPGATPDLTQPSSSCWTGTE